MTKKHFIALADAIREAKPKESRYYSTAEYLSALQAWEDTRDMVAQFCQRQNGQFNRGRWLSYIAGECGPSGGEVKAR